MSSAISEFEAAELVGDALGSWRDKLINLTAGNRLLNCRFAPTSSVVIKSPLPTALLTGLKGGVEFEVVVPQDEDQDSSGYRSPRLAEASGDPAVIARALRNLRTRASQQSLDTGLHILYLALATLEWRDADGDTRKSPLILVPVHLLHERPESPFALRLAEEDIVVNPALALKLRDLDVTLPTFEDGGVDGAGYSEFLSRVSVAVRKQPGWSVTDDSHLSYFSFTKEAMYRDLLENAAMIALNEAVAALACAGTDTARDLRFPELREDLHPDVIDQTRPPEQHPMVLNADVYQRQAIAAAVAGRSFVVEGPPGTGKSQTIANMIAALLFEGRTVLFVSEKAAALDVVHKHLSAVGLAPFVLELHTHKAKRSDVARSLAHALSHRPEPPTGLSAVERQAARDERLKLNRYAVAINSVREPFGDSPMNAMRRLGALHGVPTATPVKHLAETLTPEQMHEIFDAAGALSRAWGPSVQGDRYLWFGVVEEGALDAQLREALAALEGLRRATRVNEDVVAAFDLHRPSDAERLHLLLSHWAFRPQDPPVGWLTASALDAVREALTRLTACIANCAASDQAVLERTGRSWRDLPTAPPIAADAVTAYRRLTAHQGSVVRAQLKDVGDLALRAASAGASAAEAVGLPAPSDMGSMNRLKDALIAGTGVEPPEEAWLSLVGLAGAQDAYRALLEANCSLATAQNAAQTFFTTAALDLDLQALRSRFANVHTGLKKLSAAYRADMATIASASQPGVKPRTAITELQLAVEWQQARQSLRRAEQQHASALGSYYRGQSTNWAAAASAIDHAATIVDYARPGNSQIPVARGLHLGAPLNPVAAAIPELTALNDQWLTSASPHLFARPDSFRSAPFQAVHNWATGQLPVLDAAIEATMNLQPVLGTDVTIGTAGEVIELVERASAEHITFESFSPGFSGSLGHTFAGLDTPIESVASLIEWTEVLRRRAALTGSDGSLTAEQIVALERSAPLDLTDAITRWEHARVDLLAAFNPGRQDTLRHDLDHFADARDLLTALINDPAGRGDWFSNRKALACLDSHGLRPVVDFCVREAVPSSIVPKVVEKSVLSGWVEHVLDTSPDLRPHGASDRDDLVARYRRSDRRLIDTAITEIIQRCTARRPALPSDQSRTIEAEGKKKTRHMPVRELLARSKDVSLTVKPCFMMSPLSVSQYLPPTLKFDTVIFDEASQVRPEDAINSIYRGRALIIVGDEKQMPPTSFWDAVSTTDGDDVWIEGESNAGDFDSILTLAGGSASFESFMLQMHYRSQHESLIAYSNHSFYRGDLHTFPSARDKSEDLGVEFFHAGGVYQRGTTKDNPIEAVKVVERVIHHFDTRPDSTLGVVAFSEAQRTAIELALDSALDDRPDLRDRVESADRLRGFFVKNLETVQGDERDVIIFSVGYGPDTFGKITNNFGPLNLEGGWRRLNVAVTRARRRVEVVASLRASDIADSQNESVRHFRRYLDYAERGMAALGFEDTEGGSPESPFEESVIHAIQSWGYDVTPQVGTAGYRIDIAVRHPDKPDVYVLAVECDGYAYHSSKAARDRDRIRHDVLTGLGWNVHHIWGTAWYRQRETEERRLKEVLTAAAARNEGHLPANRTAPERPQVKVAEDELPDTPPWAHPYTVTKLPLAPGFGVDPSDPGWCPAIASDITKIVEVEGPVHSSLVDDRLKTRWQVQRIGGRIRDNIDAAKKRAGVEVRGDFLDSKGRTGPVAVRVPTADPKSRRTIDQVSDAEIRQAMLLYVRDCKGISQDVLLTSIARLFGWARSGAHIQDQMEVNLRALLRSGQLQGGEDRLTVRDL